MRSYKINTLDDIKSGYLIELQNGEKYLCTRHDQSKFEKLLINTIIGKTYALDLYNNSFCRSMDFRDLDIYKIYGLPNDIDIYTLNLNLYSSNHRPLLWERKPIEMTKKQIEEKLGYKIKIVVE